MDDSVKLIALEKLRAHPDNPNRMSGSNFAKLVRNIERSGRYEPLIVRPDPREVGFFEIINGRHRCKALAELGYKQASCIVWEIDDSQADIMLLTLNRLGGSDVLGKKLRILQRLNNELKSAQLGKLLPLRQRQIERLVSLKIPASPVQTEAGSFLSPLVFFLHQEQKGQVEKALSLAEQKGRTKAAGNAMALTRICQYFVESKQTNSASCNE